MELRWAFPLALLCSVACAAPPAVRGLFQMGGVGYASLADDNPRHSQWVAVGQTWGDYAVAAIEVDAQRVVLIRTGGSERTVVELAGASIKPATQLIELSALDWAWIRSAANPMRRYPIELPVDLPRQWAALPESERIRIRNYYRQHGYDLEVQQIGEGMFQTSYVGLRAPGEKPQGKLVKPVPISNPKNP